MQDVRPVSQRSSNFWPSQLVRRARQGGGSNAQRPRRFGAPLQVDGFYSGSSSQPAENSCYANACKATEGFDVGSASRVSQTSGPWRNVPAPLVPGHVRSLRMGEQEQETVSERDIIGFDFRTANAGEESREELCSVYEQRSEGSPNDTSDSDSVEGSEDGGHLRGNDLDSRSNGHSARSVQFQGQAIDALLPRSLHDVTRGVTIESFLPHSFIRPVAHLHEHVQRRLGVALYNVMAAASAACASTLIGEANDKYSEFTTQSFQAVLYNSYVNGRDAKYSDLEGFEDMMSLTLTDHELFSFVWQQMYIHHRRRWDSELMLFGDPETHTTNMARLWFWYAKHQYQFDISYVALANVRAPVALFQSLQSRLQDIDSIEKDVKPLYRIVSSAARKHSDFYANYRDDVRTAALNAVFQIIRTSLDVIVADVCRDDTNVRGCVVDDGIPTLAWVGRSILITDTRLLASRFLMTGSERVNYAHWLISDECIQQFMSTLHIMHTLRSRNDVVQEFSANYFSQYRQQYLTDAYKYLCENFAFNDIVDPTIERQFEYFQLDFLTDDI